MLPGYCSGDYVLVFRHKRSTFRVGDVVIVRHPRFGIIIKRISQCLDDKSLALSGDNVHASTDSHTLGRVSMEQIAGKVIWHIAATG